MSKTEISDTVRTATEAVYVKLGFGSEKRILVARIIQRAIDNATAERDAEIKWLRALLQKQ